MENYIVINGKKAELTEEQLEKLGIKPEKKNKWKEMFERRDYDRVYYFINSIGDIESTEDLKGFGDDKVFNSANYCHDETIMKQRALHETLNRLLWRASVMAGELDNPWDNKHYFIMYQLDFGGDWLINCHESVIANQIYFPSKESARSAIENIIKPFMQEHPDFVW